MTTDKLVAVPEDLRRFTTDHQHVESKAAAGGLPRRLKLAALLALPLLTACASRGAVPTRTATPLETIEIAARAEPALDTVWPGFRPIEGGFIVFQPGAGAWLLTDDSPPAPWSVVQSDVSRVEGRLYHNPADLPGLTGGIDTGYRVGSRAYTAIEYDPDVPANLTTLFHEAFHTYQADAFPPFAGEYVSPAAFTAEQLAGAELESRILAASLRAPGAASDSLIAAFLAARAARNAGLPEAVRTAERSLELKEGTAHLVGLQAVGAVGGRPGAGERAVERVVATLELDLDQYGANPAGRYRWRTYGTGSGMGALLDRLGVQWRPRAEAGVPLDSLLRDAAPIAPSAAALEHTRQRFGYAALLAEAAAEAANYAISDDPVADFLGRAPHRLVVVIEADSSARLGMSFDPGPAGFSTVAPSVTVMEHVERAAMTMPGLDLAVSGRPLMLDGGNAPSIRVVVLLPDAPLVDGRAIHDLAGPISRTLRITAAGTELLIRGEFMDSITVSGGEVTVRVRAR